MSVDRTLSVRNANHAHTSTTTVAAPVIAANGLTKSYGDVRVLDGLSLAVPQGALLGPNGAGKTTAVSILTTL